MPFKFSRKAAIITAAAVVVSGVGGGFALHHFGQQAELRNLVEQADAHVEAERVAIDELAEVIAEAERFKGEVREQHDIDELFLEVLAEAIEVARVEAADAAPAPAGATLAEAREAELAARAEVDRALEARGNVEIASAAVHTSIYGERLDHAFEAFTEASDALRDAIQTAQEVALLTESLEGDDEARETLATALDAAMQTHAVSVDGSNAAALEEATGIYLASVTALDDAMAAFPGIAE